MPQGNSSRSVDADDKMIVLNLEDGSRYNIMILIAAPNETNVSATQTREIENNCK